ncbi:aminoacyl-tRNA hydrolase [Corynebacterium sp. UBA2622]|uniref:aminoacyl-tRNA hydrolase n=1 Tax=Corynebacterium sp. UBA2622 TaxID=1946393 RepID=UPI0025B853C3|nr:aminoacyl-tRNA hydrolase [Corynebacterium sp. UBA2622]
MFDFLRRRLPRSSAPAGSPTAEWLVVGLGNPGPRYETTRHNVGCMALDELVAKAGAALAPLGGTRALVAIHEGIAYARPTTYMNESGEAVGPLAELLGVEPDHVVVLHDELDLPAGTVRLRRGGSENGHNGLKSVSEHLGTREYVRVRMGIGRPPKGTSVPDWVLSPVEGDFSAEAATAADAARLITAAGLERAQNDIHSRP